MHDINNNKESLPFFPVLVNSEVLSHNIRSLCNFHINS